MKDNSRWFDSRANSTSESWLFPALSYICLSGLAALGYPFFKQMDFFQQLKKDLKFLTRFCLLSAVILVVTLIREL